MKKKTYNDMSEENKNNLTNLIKNYEDKQFCKPWKKIHKNLKKVKISEFIRNLNCDKKQKEIYFNDIMEDLKNKKINNDYLIYDEDIGKIKSIKNIKLI